MSKKVAYFVAFHFVEQRVKEKWSIVSGGGAPCPKLLPYICHWLEGKMILNITKFRLRGGIRVKSLQTVCCSGCSQQTWTEITKAQIKGIVHPKKYYPFKEAKFIADSLRGLRWNKWGLAKLMIQSKQHCSCRFSNMHSTKINPSGLPGQLNVFLSEWLIMYFSI